MTEEKLDTTGHVIPNKRIQVRRDRREGQEGWIIEKWNREEESGDILDVHWNVKRAIQEAEGYSRTLELPVSVILSPNELREIVQHTNIPRPMVFTGVRIPAAASP
jgi:hypothetical protein